LFYSYLAFFLISLFLFSNLEFRYKVPQNEKVILCLTDPLTSSEMKRYFNSIHALKFFKSKFMQQKRKRQYVMPVLTDNNFFTESVFLMEYGRTVMDDKTGGLASAGKKCVVIPVSPFKNEYSITGSKSRNSDNVNAGLKVTTRTANSQYFLENLVQSVLTYITLKNSGDTEKYNNENLAVLENGKKENKGNDKIELLDIDELSSISVILGGDGRIINDHAIEVTTRVLAGNSVKSVILSEDSFLTTAAAAAYLREKKNKGEEGALA
jgi:hypothetical protein